MTLLQVMPDNAPEDVLVRTRDETEIAEALRSCAVAFRRWPLHGGIAPGATAEDVLSRYRCEVDQLCADEGLRVVDVARLSPQDGPEWEAQAAKARSAFLDEHRHAEDEVRFFAHGRGCFYLHVHGRVYAVVCEAGDLLSVPAGTRHWFDMGPRPDFCAIRFFKEEDGWVGDFTGDPVAQHFPHLEALLEADL
ncbi:cupin [Streptomyces sp. BHT-5-2]|uniref:1,2-dihydroxy-3-keto-5-methylthiopentene dioxygenase n=1 Tax=Streptomyces sp. BHT-5-2 TaxID=2866715 RepID=UPI001C8DA3A6|nr:cupin [Streptomyces sp. BHT-5-2]QZL04798.1 cupin [Streptomyces sp. BHT-5-2]